MPEPRRIAALTTGRQDYGILRGTLLLLGGDPRFELRVWAGGMHLSERFGRTIGRVREDGFEAVREIPFVAEPPEPVADAARAVEQVGAALVEEQPDALLLLGDRSETLAAGVAATLARVPIVHLHGGEETEGAMDNVCRHALTKLSHLHLVSHAAHAARVVQMGEDPASVVVVGAPGLDNLYRDDLPSRAEVEASLGRTLPDPVVLVTVHPATLGADPRAEVEAVARAMEEVPATYLVTAPNADAGGAAIREFWEGWGRGRENLVLVESLGEARYWSVLRFASAVLGNSSSGIIEAPAAGVPVVNVGDRQRGRQRYGFVLDVPAEPERVARALREALRRGACGEGVEEGGYPAGAAAPRIVAALAEWEIPVPPRKRFHEAACPVPA